MRAEARWPRRLPDILGEIKGGVFVFCQSEELPGYWYEFVFTEGVPNGMSLSFQESVSHAAGDEEGVYFTEQTFEDPEFRGDFGATYDRIEGVGGLFEMLS